MKQLSGKDLARFAQKRGWSLSRVNGSHHVFTKPGERARLTIPIHGNSPLKIGLLKNLMQIIGIQPDDL